MDVTAGLAGFVARHPRLFILTGAGCSTGSGIPDYRDANGAWKRAQPMTFQAFTGGEAARQRYWARGLLGWRRIGSARPNRVHQALAAWETAGGIELLLTQNVDGLHQRAGSRRVLDLHGRLDTVRCLGCGRTLGREAMQADLVRLNPDWADLDAPEAPDGDADLEGRDFSRFAVPPCRACGGVLKPDVVFFGESVPRARVEEAMAALHRADAMLILGSSLMVYSGFRFAQAAAEAGKPIAAVNLGRTRADDLLALKVEAECGEALASLLREPCPVP